jgi:hypothetical protein
MVAGLHVVALVVEDERLVLVSSERPEQIGSGDLVRKWYWQE